MLNIAISEQSSHTPGGSHQRLTHFQRKDKIVKDFIILNQVVAEKTLMKKCPYVLYKSDRRKNRKFEKKRQNDD